MGTGMHGENGISPVIATSLWDTFIIQRMLHGIEFLDVRKKRYSLDQIELHQRKIFKIYYNPYQKTPQQQEFRYRLLGKIPIEGCLVTKDTSQHSMASQRTNI